MTDTLVQALSRHPEYALLIVALNAFLEATLVIGLFVPGAVLVVVSTFVYTQGFATLAEIMLAAFAGAFVADNLGFQLGRLLGPSFHQTRLAKKYTRQVKKSEELVLRYGWGAILLGRLITAVRSLIPLLTGISGFSTLRYLAFDLVACVLWAGGLGLIVKGVQNVLG